MERNQWLDGIKFVLIILVIFGHCKQFTNYDSSLLSTKLVSSAIHTVYLFHMPLFIMISGFFSKKKPEKFISNTKKILKVFIIFHLLWISLDLACGKSISFNRLISPSFSLWYLLSLSYWRIILQFIPENYDKSYIMLPLTFMLSLLGGLLPLTNEFSIPRTLTFMPLFFLGYYTNKNNWLRIILQSNIIFIILITFTLIIIENHFYWVLDVNGKRPYMNIIDAIKRATFLCSSLIISIAFIKILPHGILFFAKEGKRVLFYYVYHSFVLFAIAKFLDLMGVVLDGIGLIIISFITIYILFICRKINWLYIPLK